MSSVVLLTGATGFVGRQVLKELIKQKVAVRLVIREGNEGLIENTSNIESMISTPDLFSEPVSWWSNVCKGVDTIIHVAWYAEPGKYLMSSKNLDCLTGTINLAKGAILAGIRRFIGVGTCFEYDLSGGFLSVKTSLRPLTPYAGTKAAAYMALSQCLPESNVEFAWCRMFYLYGEGEDSRRLIPYIRNQLSMGKQAELTSGNQVRDYMDVTEAGIKIVNTALSNQQGAVNICSGIPVTVRQLVEKVADEYDGIKLLKFGVRPDNITDPPCVVGVS